MTLVKCPDCGAQVSSTAVVCMQCGFPLAGREDLGPPTRFDRAARRNRLTFAAGAVGIVGVVALGVVAAIVIPRVAAAASAAKEREGVELLKQVHALENTYWQKHGAYAPTLDALKGVGWKEPEKLRHYTVEITSWEAADLCLQALPRPGSGVRPIRMRSVGYVEPGARCDAYGGDSTTVKDDALRALREAYRGIAAWWQERQRPPETDAELREAIVADPGFVIGLTPLSNGGMCVHVAPRTQPPSAVVFSLDIGGNVYAGDGCAGTPVERAYR
ncbi:MAG TPA: zinc ribbon domain-containing protein [Longimicrobium sp.]|nr:zinc ribbon domain-containing protein [Longimicrobium sp.]